MRTFLITYIDELFQEYSKEILNKNKLGIHENLRLYFYYFRKHEKLISNLIKSDLSNMLLKKCSEFFHILFQEIACNKSYSEEKQKFWIEYLTGGLFNILIEWAKGGMKQSDKHMEKIVSGFV